MDWKTFISSLIGHLAWPAFLLTALILLRKQLADVVSRLARLRYKDIEAEFEKGLQRAKQEANAAKLPQLEAEKEPQGQTIQDPSTPRRTGYLLQMAEIFPEATVLEAWRDLEQAMRETFRTADLDYALKKPAQKIPVKTLINALRGHHPEPGLLSIVEELFALRNRIAHSGYAGLSVEKAKDYVEATSRVSQELWRIVGC